MMYVYIHQVMGRLVLVKPEQSYPGTGLLSNSRSASPVDHVLTHGALVATARPASLQGLHQIAERVVQLLQLLLALKLSLALPFCLRRSPALSRLLLCRLSLRGLPGGVLRVLNRAAIKGVGRTGAARGL